MASKAKPYLFAVQDSNGREVCSVTYETARVGDVLTKIEDGRVHIGTKADGSLADGPAVEGMTYTLHRWPTDDKLGEPVSKPVS